ncbi:MAG TPA: response regulator, partial [Burkholderiaceae bacterium]
VVDDGLGMSAEQLAHLFEPFNRLGREGSVEGTGIGLVLSRQLMTLMRGSIEVRSEAGRGTRVHLTLPALAAAPQRVPAPAARAEAPEAPAGSLLYIEDNPVNARLVRELLARWPALRFTHAEDGARGIEAARRVQPDVVLVDMRLPDMDGADVLRALRADPALREPRLVALSASAMPDEVERARRCGAEDYWTKPIDFERFLADLRRVLA